MKSTLSRRAFLKIAVSSSGAMALAACAAQPPAAPVAQEPAAEPAVAGPTEAPPAPTLAAPSAEETVVEAWVQEASIPPQKKVSEDFMAENPNIKINFVPTTLADTATKLLASIAAGSGGPDLAFVQYTDIVNFTLRGGEGIADLGPMMAERKDEWLAWCLKIVTTDSGKILGIPTDVGIAANFYSRDVFEKAGIKSDPESVAAATATWDDYLVAAEAVKNPGDQWILANASELFEVFRQQQGQAYFDKSGEPIVNTEPFVSAATYAQDFRNAGLDANVSVWGNEWGDMMVKRVIGTYPYAAWWDIILHAYTPDSAGSWGVAPLPGGANANFGGSYYLMPEQSTEKEAAWAYASYAVGTLEGIEAYLTGGAGLWLPGWKTAYDLPVFTSPDPYYGGQAWLKIFTANAENVPDIYLTVNDSVARRPWPMR
jgi:multiple sugar transport system substrate-binding protein